MKKIIFTLIVISSFTFYRLNAQVIEDFEGPNALLGFSDPSIDTSYASLVTNPYQTGINTSKTVLKFVRDRVNGWNNFGYQVQPFMLEKDMYIHIKVWKPRISPLSIELDSYIEFGMPNVAVPSGLYNGKDPIQLQTKINEWEELVFSFNPNNFIIRYFSIYPDNVGTIEPTDDVVMYFDDITINHSPVVGSAPEIVLMDFEPIPLNLMLGGAEDKSAMTLSYNPDKDSSEVNISSNVVKFVRDKDGVPWGGFWSTLKSPIDITQNKYMHVKVWKPRISPIKFKIEGGVAGNLEVESKYPQTKINDWEDIVFDLSSKTGTYPTIAFMPDFKDPVTLTEDIVIYFDDIVLNNDPLPRSVSQVVINVDMSQSGLSVGDKVYITGSFDENFVTWVDTTTNEANEMTDPEGDGIFSITKKSADGPFSFQFYYKTNAGKFVGDYGTNERNYVINGNTVINCKWQVGGTIIPAKEPKIQVFNVDMNEAGLTAGEKVFISGSFGGAYGNWTEPGTNTKTEMTDTDGDGIYSIVLDLSDGNYQFKFFKGTGWDGGEWLGDPNRSFSLEGSKTIVCTWGNPEVKLSMISCNLITNGNFDTEGPLLGEWVELNTDYVYPSVKVIDGVLTLNNNVASPYYWRTSVWQLINDYGKMMYNDSVYLLVFDAWADKTRKCFFYLEDNATNGFPRVGTSGDFDSVDGTSTWNINLTAKKTTYYRTVTMNKNLPNSSFIFHIASGSGTETVYVDNVCLFKLSDYQKYNIKVSKINVSGEGGATSINTNKGSLQMYASVIPQYSWINDIEWSVINGTGNAVINQNGLLTAVTNGIVKVIASNESLDGSMAVDSLEITITNQEFLKDSIIDFENISDFAWNVFNNGINTAQNFSMVVNPYKSKVNSSENVLKFIVNQESGTAASASSTAFGPVCFKCGDGNFIINLSIKKPVKTVVGIKLEQCTDGSPDTMITATSNAIDTWQKLKFDFSACSGRTYQKVTIYPDVKATSPAGTVFYIDNIEFPSSQCDECTVGISANESSSIKIYPNPVKDILNVVLNAANTKLTIYNSLGSKMDERFAYENIAKINVTNYAPGVYILKTGDGSVVKFIK